MQYSFLFNFINLFVAQGNIVSPESSIQNWPRPGKPCESWPPVDRPSPTHPWLKHCLPIPYKGIKHYLRRMCRTEKSPPTIEAQVQGGTDQAGQEQELPVLCLCLKAMSYLGREEWVCGGGVGGVGERECLGWTFHCLCFEDSAYLCWEDLSNFKRLSKQSFRPYACMSPLFRLARNLLHHLQ